jgi:hypothetical protein
MSKTRTNGTKRAVAHPARPIFDAMIAEAKNAPPESLITAEELDQRRPLTPEEIAEADAWLDELEREGAVSISSACGDDAPIATSGGDTDRRDLAKRARTRP